MADQGVFEQVISFAQGMHIWEVLGLIFGLLAVIFLVWENIWTWPTGIAYVLVSFVVFWRAQLLGDLILHVFYLILNIYGWYHWVHGNKETEEELKITTVPFRRSIVYVIASGVGIFLFGLLLTYTNRASLPFWDSATSILSVTGMWLTARKKLENWYYWLVVDILATGIYLYKEMYFYSFLYFIYIGLAIAGYREWRRLMRLQTA